MNLSNIQALMELENILVRIKNDHLCHLSFTHFRSPFRAGLLYQSSTLMFWKCSQFIELVIGDIECDFLLGLDLLQSPKDDIEYTIVRDWLKHSLGELCKEVVVEVPKSILKLGAVQHLYGKLSGRLLGNTSDSDILVRAHWMIVPWV